jgi:cytoskeletal protein CcmA (bactofilin family)
MSTDGEKSGNIVIGEGVTVTGTLNVPGKATINGWLQGELTADELTVGTQGKVVGKVNVRIADIHGSMHKSIAASEQLIIRSTGQVHGLAIYGKIEIARGGMIVGNLEPIDTAAPDVSGLKALNMSSDFFELPSV